MSEDLQKIHDAFAKAEKAFQERFGDVNGTVSLVGGLPTQAVGYSGELYYLDVDGTYFHISKVQCRTTLFKVSNTLRALWKECDHMESLATTDAIVESVERFARRADNG